jgi:hypothetical protein
LTTTRVSGSHGHVAELARQRKAEPGAAITAHAFGSSGRARQHVVGGSDEWADMPTFRAIASHLDALDFAFA